MSVGVVQEIPSQSGLANIEGLELQLVGKSIGEEASPIFAAVTEQFGKWEANEIAGAMELIAAVEAFE